MGLGRIPLRLSWLQAKCRISGGEAVSRTRRPTASTSCCLDRRDVPRGEMTFGHVRALTNAVGGIDPERVAEAEPYLLSGGAAK